MTTGLDDMMTCLDPTRRRNVEDRAAQLVAVEMMPRGVGDLLHFRLFRLARLAMEGEFRWA